MNIRIEKKNASLSIIDENSIKWKLFIEKNKKIILYQFLIGFAFIIWGLVDKDSKSYNVNIILSFGIAFFILAIMYSFQIYQNKQRFFGKIKLYSYRLGQNDSNILIEITDEIIKYQDFELFQEIRWTLFTHYKLYRDYLFLIMDESLLSSIIIHKRQLEENEFIELSDFVKNKLLEKK